VRDVLFGATTLVCTVVAASGTHGVTQGALGDSLDPIDETIGLTTPKTDVVCGRLICLDRQPSARSGIPVSARGWLR